MIESTRSIRRRELGSSSALVNELKLDGVTSKAWTTQDGKSRDGRLTLSVPNHITLLDLAVDPPALWDEQRDRLSSR